MGVVLLAAVFAAVFMPGVYTVARTFAAVGEQDISKAFENKGFLLKEKSDDPDSGVFIIRDQSPGGLVERANETDAFRGTAKISNDIILTGSQAFRYEAVQKIGGVWYTAQEYTDFLKDRSDKFGTFKEESNSVGDWFFIEPYPDGYDDQAEPHCIWHLRIKSPAGKYGVRARAVRVEEELIDGIIQKRPYDIFDSITGKEKDFYFTILYGDDYKYIRCIDDRGDTVYDVKKHGIENRLRIYVTANSGAMQMETEYILTTGGTCQYQAGNLQSPLDIAFAELPDIMVSVTRNGQSINLPYSWEGNAIEVNLPKTLPKGRYLITVTHAYYRDIVGTYVIDNGNPVPGLGSTVGAGIVLIVLGIIAAMIGFTFVAGPRIVYSMKEKRYKAIESKVYKTDAKSMRQREKEQKEAQETEKQKQVSGQKSVEEGRSFRARLEEYRHKRESARTAGLSIDEYREVERDEKKKEEVSKYSMSGVREEVKVTEVQPTEPEVANTRQIIDGMEVDTLDSVRTENILHGSPLAAPAASSIDPAAQDQKPEGETPPPMTGGILSRIQKFNSE